MVKFFLFPQSGIFERALTRGEGPSVRPMHKSMRMQDLEILANRNLGGFELAGQFCDQNAAMMVEHIENGATTFFVQHKSRLRARRRVSDQRQRAYFFL